MSKIRGKFLQLQKKINEKSYKTTEIYLQPLDRFISATDIFRQFMAISFTPELTVLFFNFIWKGNGRKTEEKIQNLLVQFQRTYKALFSSSST
jgi:hypothetical protein